MKRMRIALACSQELVDFAAFRLKPKGGERTSYPFVHDCTEAGGEVCATCNAGADKVGRAELNWTADRGDWEHRAWQTREIPLQGDGATAVAELPDGVSAWYVNFFTADAKARVRRLDHGHADWHEIPSGWDGKNLHLAKEAPGSAAFLVNFESERGDGHGQGSGL